MHIVFLQVNALQFVFDCFGMEVCAPGDMMLKELPLQFSVKSLGSNDSVEISVLNHQKEFE